LYWIRVYYWWLLREYIPLVEKHRYTGTLLHVVARLTYNFVLGLLLVVDAVRVMVRA
jgi:hypothetical protein